MRCYSHLSDDEREQMGLAKAQGHLIGAIARAIFAVRNGRSRANSGVTSLAAASGMEHLPAYYHAPDIV